MPKKLSRADFLRIANAALSLSAEDFSIVAAMRGAQEAEKKQKATARKVRVVRPGVSESQ